MTIILMIVIVLAQRSDYQLISTDITVTTPTRLLVEENKSLVIYGNEYEFLLFSNITAKLSLNASFIQINHSTNLSDLFMNNNFLDNYSFITICFSQVKKTLNSSIIDEMKNYVNNGGIIQIISSEVWQLPKDFLSFVGFNPINNSVKIFPTNQTREIDFSIINSSMCKEPYFFEKSDNFSVDCKIGLGSAINQSIVVALSETTSKGYTEIIVNRFGKGYFSLLPISFNNNSVVSNSYIRFQSSLIKGIIDRRNVNLNNNLSFTDTTTGDTLPSTTDNINSSSSITSQVEGSTTSNELIDLDNSFEEGFYPKLLFSNNLLIQTITIGIPSLVVGGSLLVLINRKRSLSSRNQYEIMVPSDTSKIITIVSVVIFIIGQIIYPPVIRRIKYKSVMENETRSMIINLLKKRKFMHFRELKRNTKAGTSILKWHLRVLEDFKIIDKINHGQYEIYFLKENIPDQEIIKLYFSSLMSSTGYRIAKVFLEQSEWNVKHLSKYLHTSKETVKYHCEKLVRNNVLSQSSKGSYRIKKSKLALLKEAVRLRELY